VQANGIQLMGNREYNVVVLYRQSTLQQILDPERLFCSLALWTMPVATAIVAVANGATVVTRFFMATKNSGAAHGYFAQNFQMKGCCFVTSKKFGSEKLYRISQLKACLHF
jgi:hypothetical protein